MSNAFLLFIALCSWTIYGRSFIPLPSSLKPIGPDPKGNPLEVDAQYQRNFCANMNSYIKDDVESRIKKVPVFMINEDFEMYVYKTGDYVSNEIMHSKSWEPTEIGQIYEGLKNYMKKNQITDPSKITFLDIGVQLGSFSMSIGAKGFNVIGFEPMRDNAYISRKNFCMNKNKDNMVLIEKGVGNTTMNCALYNYRTNVGDPIMICNSSVESGYVFKESVDLVKLDDYEPYLRDKNIVMLKMDIEGFEHYALKGGRKLILEGHIPMISTEYCIHHLNQRGSSEREYLADLQAAGYKFSLTGFDKKYVTLDQVVTYARTHFIVNLCVMYDPNP